MTIEFIKKIQGIAETPTQFDAQGNEIAWDKYSVILWKFKDENGNVWNTETSMNGTEDQAREIILGLS